MYPDTPPVDGDYRWTGPGRRGLTSFTSTRPRSRISPGSTDTVYAVSISRDSFGILGGILRFGPSWGHPSDLRPNRGRKVSGPRCGRGMWVLPQGEEQSRRDPM